MELGKTGFIGEMTMMLYLVRHGKDDDSIRGGWSNHGLVPFGVEQVNKLASEMVAANMSIDYIYSSDLQRTKETAEILSNYLGCPVEYITGLRETNNGDLAGMEHGLANEKYPGVYWSSLAYDECYPNGESPEMFYNRVKTTWIELKNKILEQPTKSTLIVTHQGVIEVILCIENNIVFSNKEKHFSVPNAKLIPIEI